MRRRNEGESISRRRLLGTGAALMGSTTALVSGARDAHAVEAIPQPGSPSRKAFIDRAFVMRDQATAAGDQGYGAVIVDGSGKIVGQAPSRVVTNGDPTAHAEMEAIRDAARRIGSRNLSGHIMYSSSRPCPMCEAAAYWAGLDVMIHGRSGTDAGRPRLCG